VKLPLNDALYAVLKDLSTRLKSVKAGEVLTMGIQQKPGAIGNAVVRDVQRNSSIGTNLKRAQGDR
jgi:hypothetical protein